MIQYTLHNLKHTRQYDVYIYIYIYRVSYRLYGYSLDTVFMYLIYEIMHMCIDLCKQDIM